MRKYDRWKKSFEKVIGEWRGLVRRLDWWESVVDLIGREEGEVGELYC